MPLLKTMSIRHSHIQLFTKQQYSKTSIHNNINIIILISLKELNLISQTIRQQARWTHQGLKALWTIQNLRLVHKPHNLLVKEQHIHKKLNYIFPC